MLNVVTHLTAPKESKDTLRDLGVFLAGMAGSQISKTVGQSDSIQMLRGQKDCPPLMMKFVRMIDSFSDNPTVVETGVSACLDFLATKGFSRDSVLAMFKSYAPVLDVKIEEATVSSVAKAITAISKTIIQNDDTIELTAVIDCPKCEFVFMV